MSESGDEADKRDTTYFILKEKKILIKKIFNSFFFTGQMLMKWLISSLQQSGSNLNEQDLNNLTIQYCNNLINVGVLKQISEETDIKNFSVSI